MAEVLFYEKRGCINNTKQKQLLKQAAHTVNAKDLLAEPWSASRLRLFFGDKPLDEWFNHSAPSIKEGKIDPTLMNEEQALEAMCKEPLLIRRPLMQVGNEYCIGFDMAWVDAWIGLKVVNTDQDLENCPRSHEKENCK